MLALKQALSLVSLKRLGSDWTPSDEGSNLIAWYKNKTGITLNGSDVSQWEDSANSYDMVQADAGEQPAYNASTGALTFDPTSDTQNLQTSGQISLSGNFTIGIKCYPQAFNNVLLADNTTTNEMFKYTSSSNIRIKIDTPSAVNIPLDSGTFGDDYLVLTRVSNVLTLHKNGVAQSTTPTLSGTADIDAIGVRSTDMNPYDGDVSELQIYDTSSSGLTANINTYLSNI